MTDTATTLPELEGFEGQDVESKDDRRARFEVKASTVDVEQRTFEGLASTWSLDRGGDVIERGAFKRTLGRWRAANRGDGKSVIPLLDQHDRFTSVEAVLGKLVEAKETPDGLAVKFEIAETSRGDEVLTLLAGDFVDGLSIGYRPVKVRVPTDKERGKGVWRFLEEVALKEISLVVFPMNEEARVKSDEDDDATPASTGAPEEPVAESGDPAPGLAPDSTERAAMQRKLRELQLGDLTGRSTLST